MSRCITDLSQQEITDSNQLIVKKPLINKSYYTRGVALNGGETLLQREQFHDVANQCFNLRLRKNYGLVAYSEIEFCIDHDKREVDLLDILFLTVAIGLATLVLAATILDWFTLKNNFRAFSTLHNWNKHYRNQSDSNYIFLDAVRFPLTALNVIAHVAILLAVPPSSNSKFHEAIRYEFLTQFGFNIPLSVTVFFGISAFLLTLGDINAMNKGKELGFKDFTVKVRKRVVRLVPLYAFVLLFEATWVRRFGSGPDWEVLAGRQWAYCRNSYWTNLLFVNNFVNVDQQCVLPSKYEDLFLYLKVSTIEPAAT